MVAKPKIASAMVLVVGLMLCLMPLTASAGGYPSLEGLKAFKAVIDFRDGDPVSAMEHLELLDWVKNDKAVAAVTDKPALVVIFMGSSVRLLSNQRDGFSELEAKAIDKFHSIITTLSKQGVRLEVCGIALKYFNVDPKSVPAELQHVPNGWISSVGYQHKGYALVPSY